MKEAFLISFGLGGHGVDTRETWGEGSVSKGNISGYDSPESFERALIRGEKNEYPPLSGIPVLDKRAALQKNPAFSFKSPLVDVDLQEGEIDRINTDSARTMLPGLSGGFETLAALAIAHEGKSEPGPLDSVSVSDYVRWWRERGARLGHMDKTGTRIIWEDEKGGVS